MTALDTDFARILDGGAEHAEIMDFLARSVAWMGDPEALAAGARALRKRVLRVNAPEGAIDVCGTGGDGAHTLNISTAVAFVVAGAGVPVAKHGNRAMSSKSGAADVLEALGVKLTADTPTLERCLREANVAFLFAQNHHPALRHVAAARKEFGQRTIFNLLGPLANPAGVKRQLVGVFAPEFVVPVAQALDALDVECALVVHGAGGADEITLAGPFFCSEVLPSAKWLTFGPDEPPEVLGLQQHPIEALRGGSTQENAAHLRALLQGNARNSAYEQTVILNAAAALYVWHKFENTLWARLPAAIESIRSGAALAALDKLIAITQAAP